MGALVALEAAIAYPERVAGLLLISAAARLPRLPALERALAGSAERFAERFGRLAFSPFAPRERRERWTRSLAAAAWDELRADFAACQRYDGRGRLGDLHVPALVVAGADDLIVPPAESEALAAALPAARMVVVRGAGHALPVEYPAELARLTLELAAALA
jgi:pimeloyl-ACP methyl ester carboxylesterase